MHLDDSDSETRAPARYELLDSWRGLAALAVAGFHAINQLVEPGRSWFAAILWSGWGGVYVFFPISGYCILAATHSAANRTTGSFLRRRWRRIFPTYWASIAFAVVVALALSPFSRGSLSSLQEPGFKWVSILTLTQTFTGMADVINPVYWSLCYEEQFYLVVAATLLAPAIYRPRILFGVSVLAVAICCFRVHVPPGLFLDRWLNFAVGLAVFGWFDHRYGRLWAAMTLSLATFVAVSSRQPDLAISIGAAALFIALRPFDRVLTLSIPGRALGAVGVASYSLYLIHVPIVGRIVNLSRRFDPQAAGAWPLVAIGAVAASVACAFVFHRLIETRFQGHSSAPCAHALAVAARVA